MFISYSIKSNLKFLFSSIAIACMLCFNSCNRALANNKAESYPQKPLLKIFVSFNKTTNLIFPYAIKSVDRGSQEIIARLASGADNILALKAAGQDFRETNLTVITVGGHLYSFIIDYDYNPPQLNFILSKEDCVNPMPENLNAIAHPAIVANMQIVSTKKSNIHIRDRKDGLVFSLTGLYVKNGIFYFKLIIENNSPIDYRISQLRFFIADKRKMRRTASQELELLPLSKSDSNTIV